VQAENFGPRNPCEIRGQRGHFKAAVDGVTSLGVAALEFKKIAGFNADTSAAETNAGRSELTQAGGKSQGGRGLSSVCRLGIAHGVSNLSG
jgi:hypothetical protein